MALEALVDTDVLYKLTQYGLLAKWFQSEPLGANCFWILAAAPHMIKKKLKKNPPARGLELAQAEFTEAVRKAIIFEPSMEEIQLAAELELLAQKENLALDGGESLLCAVLLVRAKQPIFTGDKRALNGIAQLLAKGLYEKLNKNFVCLEQIILHMLESVHAQLIRNAICAESNAERAIAICFSCTATQFDFDNCRQGLLSYINNINKESPNVLAPNWLQ